MKFLAGVGISSIKEKLFEAIVESSDDAILSKNLEGIVTSWNTSAEYMFGYTPEEIIGSPILKLFPPELVDEEKIILGQIVQGHRANHFETVRIRKDCSHIDVSVTLSPIFDDGKVIGASKIVRDITERKQMEEQLQNQALHDQLTQLPNRRLLYDRLDQAMTANNRNGRYGAVIFMDLDNFKSLNDTHGHNAGDLLLIEVARRLTHCVRKVDTVARLGGDEFVVLLRDMMKDKESSILEANIITQRILSSLSMRYVLTWQNQGDTATTIEHTCTASIGVALFFNDELSSKNIVNLADKAMYQAKSEGKNRIVFNNSK